VNLMDALRRSVQAGRPAAKKGKRLAAIAAWPQGGVPARREIQPVSLSRPAPARAAALDVPLTSFSKFIAEIAGIAEQPLRV